MFSQLLPSPQSRSKKPFSRGTEKSCPKFRESIEGESCGALPDTEWWRHRWDETHHIELQRRSHSPLLLWCSVTAVSCRRHVLLPDQISMLEYRCIDSVSTATTLAVTNNKWRIDMECQWTTTARVRPPEQRAASSCVQSAGVTSLGIKASFVIYLACLHLNIACLWWRWDLWQTCISLQL